MVKNNKIILTKITPKMDREEAYKKLVQNLKKQGIKVKADKKKGS